MDPTNVHFIFLQQEVVFANFWCQMTPRKPIGIPQRFLFSFGGDADPAPMLYKDFMEEVTLPVLRDVFTLIVRSVGSKMTGTDDPHIDCSKDRNLVVEENEHVVKLHARKHEVPDSFKSALPKSLYWTGTAVLLNHSIASVWPSAMSGEDFSHMPSEMQDDYV